MKYLKDLVGIDSSTDCENIVEYLNTQLLNKVDEIKILKDKEGKTMALVAGINTKLTCIEPVVLSGHIDTVSANMKLYSTNPYVWTQKDGKMFGLGTIDMKSFSAIVLDNIDEIKSKPYPIVLAITTDEETTLKSIEKVINFFKISNIKPKLTIVGEPTYGDFYLVANGCYEFVVEFFGKTCHSSRPKDGVNAICAAAKLITFVEEKQNDYDLTSNCGVIQGGEVPNKVPDYVRLKFDIRSTKTEDVENFMLDIKQKLLQIKQQYSGLNYKIENELCIPAFNNANSEKLRTMATNLKVCVSTLSGSCEAGYFTEYSGEAVIFGVGDLSLAHKPDEYVVIDDYYRYSKKLSEFLNCIKDFYF